MPEHLTIDALLEEALELKWFLPVLVDAQAAPLVWVDPAQCIGHYPDHLGTMGAPSPWASRPFRRSRSSYSVLVRT